MPLAFAQQNILSALGHFGWIPPSQRTQAQQDQHARVTAALPRFAAPPVAAAGPLKIILTDFWKHPDVVADIGSPFTGYRQLTGSCVGVSAGNFVFTLGAVQRVLSDAPTKAFVPFWPFFYGRTRYNEGDRGQGEGAVDSVMGETLVKEGVFDIGQSGLPTFDRSDGLALTSNQELQYSDGAASVVTKWQALAAQHTLGAITVCNSTADIKNFICNGYPVIDGCDDYMAHGAIQGSSDQACVIGQYDGRGGHSTCFLGYWDHPTFGPLFLYSNQWDGSTYPTDPAGGGRCTCWMKEATVAKLFSMGGSGGECFAGSHLNWFPAQPKLLDYVLF